MAGGVLHQTVFQLESIHPGVMSVKGGVAIKFAYRDARQQLTKHTPYSSGLGR